MPRVPSALALVLIASCGSAVEPEAESAHPPAEAPTHDRESSAPSEGATERPSEADRATSRGAAAPRVVMPTRALGPFESMCAGASQLRHADLAMPIECADAAVRAGDEMQGAVTAESRRVPAPFLEAAVFDAPSPLRVGEIAATFLALRTSRGWWLAPLGVFASPAVGYGESCGVGGAAITARGSLVRVDYEHRCTTDVSYAGSDEERARPTETVADRFAALCRPTARGVACASVAIGGQRTGGGRATRWSAELNVDDSESASLSEPRGDAPDDAIGGALDLTFEDAARTRAQGFANRCARLRRAGRAEEARAACAAGLRSDPDATETGSLEYERGRILEAAGDVAAAREAYRRSLDARPHAVTRARLEGLPSN